MSETKDNGAIEPVNPFPVPKGTWVTVRAQVHSFRWDSSKKEPRVYLTIPGRLYHKEFFGVDLSDIRLEKPPEGGK